MSEATRAYNDIAIHYAERISQGAKKRKRPSPERAADVFPAENRPGLGVHLEYERMGNQPVSDELSARADAAGVRFEHIGLTLGTVLHNIDLKQPLSPDTVSLLMSSDC